jgi:hypothetical protein
MKKIWYIGNSFKSSQSFFERFNPAIHYSFFHRNPNITTFGEVFDVDDNTTLNVGFDNGLIDVDFLENNITGSGRLTLMNNQGFLGTVNSFEMRQSSVGSMPFLVRNGQVVRNSNNNVALDFVSGNYFMSSAGNSAAHGVRLLDKDCTMFVVYRSQNNNSLQPVMFEGVGNNRVGIATDTRVPPNRRHTVYRPQGDSSPFDLDWTTQQPQLTNRILTFRRNDAANNLIEAFDEDFNLVDSLTNVIKYSGTPQSNPVRLYLGTQTASISSFLNSLWLETVIFDKPLINTEAQDVLNVLKNDFNVS